jgi:hypothetical protein
MVDELVELARAAGTALVGAMATDVWQVARSGMARLFGRGVHSQKLSKSNLIVTPL